MLVSVVYCKLRPKRARTNTHTYDWVLRVHARTHAMRHILRTRTRYDLSISHSISHSLLAIHVRRAPFSLLSSGSKLNANTRKADGRKSLSKWHESISFCFVLFLSFVFDHRILKLQGVTFFLLILKESRSYRVRTSSSSEYVPPTLQIDLKS